MRTQLNASRNLDIVSDCRDVFMNEVHDDSQPFSRSLWAIHKRVKQNAINNSQNWTTAVNRLDKLLLFTLAQAGNSETFLQQSQRILTALQADSATSNFPSDIVSVATTAFATHGVNPICQRAYTPDMLTAR